MPALKVLVAHNAYQRPGGEDVSFRSEVEVLRRHGHPVKTYTRDNREIAERGGLGLALRTLWNPRTTSDLNALFQSWNPDIVHFNNTFPLISLAGIHAAHGARIPVVVSIRNYRFRCVNGLFFRDGSVCEDCLNRRLPWPGVVHACYRNSRAASAVGVGAIGLHRALSTYERKVDVLISLSEFARAKMIEDGLPADRIVVKPNFLLDDPGHGTGSGGYALYVGRLSREKGVGTLLRAWKEGGPEIPLKIVGGGPLEEEITAQAQEAPLVELLGHRSHADVIELMGNAALLVLPSEWYETFGRVAIESFARGTPVLASRIGAVAELVAHGRNGHLFMPGDPDDLSDQVKQMTSDAGYLRAMRTAARAEFERRYTAERNYETLAEIYDLAIRRSG